jgi:hypothetical protein
MLTVVFFTISLSVGFCYALVKFRDDKLEERLTSLETRFEQATEQSDLVLSAFRSFVVQSLGAHEFGSGVFHELLDRSLARERVKRTTSELRQIQDELERCYLEIVALTENDIDALRAVLPPLGQQFGDSATRDRLSRLATILPEQDGRVLLLRAAAREIETRFRLRQVER